MSIFPSRHGFRSIVIALFTAAILHCQLFAWGPHTEIAQAALDALGPDDPLTRRLGEDTKRLAQYVWMADWRQQLLVRSDEVFYSDDYLLFPAAVRHYDHICPDVKLTYSPFFRRALQALRTESKRNAARWIGSLLHFTTDTGSPPHAAEIRGPVHTKMENWVNAKWIHIPGYQPQLLGTDDSAAEAAFLRRMDGLIAFSKERAQRCRADLDADRREAVEPVVLESALETARVTADLLHTLGVLAAKTTGGASLAGKVITPTLENSPLSRLPAKIMLVGTTFSTLTGADGTFSFHHLPAGEYHLLISAPGCFAEPKTANLAEASAVTLDPVDLSRAAEGNLVRNGNFALRWVSPTGFDDWSARKPAGKAAAMSRARDWEGEWIPLQKGVTYQLAARWKLNAADVQVFLRTKAKPDYGSSPTDSAALLPGTKELMITVSPEAAWAQVCIRTPQTPDSALDGVILRPAP